MISHYANKPRFIMMELYGLGIFRGNSNSKYLLSYSFLLNKQAYKSKIQIVTNHCNIIAVPDELAPDTGV